MGQEDWKKLKMPFKKVYFRKLIISKIFRDQFNVYEF